MGNRKAKRNYRRTVLRLPDLDHSKLAVLNSLASLGSRRVYKYASNNSLPGTVQSLAWPSIASSLCGIACTSKHEAWLPIPSINNSLPFDDSLMKQRILAS